MANLGFHAEVLLTGAAGASARAGVAGYALLVMIMGGRIVPSFTRNWLAMQGGDRFPVPFGRADAVAIVAALAALLVWVVAPDGAPAAVGRGGGRGRSSSGGCRAGAGWRRGREPLLLVLHVAFGFVGLGFLAIAAGAVGWLPAAGAMHVMMVGGIAGMMLAVMTRATRGHTGHALDRVALDGGGLCLPVRRRRWRGRRRTCWARRCCWRWPACLWIAAFGLFLAEYGPMLLRDRKPRAG